MKNKITYPTNENLARHFLVSFIVVAAWMIIVKDQYYYNYNFFEIFGISLFPLVIAPIGLLFIYIIYSSLVVHLKLNNLFSRFSFFVFIYWVMLILAETIGYHGLSINNLGTANYPGLPMCDCIHAPGWMQLGYLLIGPIYFIICILLNLETNKKYVRQI